MRKKVNIVLFIVYIIIVLYLTIINRNTYSSSMINFKLFANLEFVASHSFRKFLYYFLGNIAVFIPLGYFIKELLNINFIKAIILIIIISFFIESYQYIFKVGIFELDDLILNTFGGILGFLGNLLFFKVKSIIKKEDNYV